MSCVQLALFTLAPAGCWSKFPSGCPRQKQHAKYSPLQNTWRWNHETFRDASKSDEKCKARKNPLNNWCGVSDIVVQYVEGRNILYPLRFI